MSDPFAPAAVEERIRAYEGFGIHRTGWPGDDASAEWMRGILAAAGVDARLERFVFPRVELRRSRIVLGDGQAIEGVPLYDGGFTPGPGVGAELVDPDSTDLFGSIVVTAENDPAYALPNIARRIEDLEEAGAVGLLLVKGDPKGAVTVLNAERIDRPFRLPVLQVSPRDARQLASAQLLRHEVTLDIDGERLQSRAQNVVATLPGTDPDATPIGVMTPRSGWFTCAAERGGGIAILLGVAEAMASRPHRRTIEFVASSGHELHHYGLAAYLRTRPGIEAKAHAWLHLGANIGSATGPTRMEGNDAALQAAAEATLAASGATFEVITQKGGEARNIDEAGGRYVSFRGANDYFHSPNDTFDVACNATEVAAAGRAALELVAQWADA